jgi:hypothetical protein
MSRPATNRRKVAGALRIDEDQVPARLRRLHAATESIRAVADFLATRGATVSKSWLHRELATTVEEDPS